MAKNQLKSEKYVSYHFSASKHSVEWIRFQNPVKSGDILKAFMLVGIQSAVRKNGNQAAPVRTVSMATPISPIHSWLATATMNSAPVRLRLFFGKRRTLHVQMLSHAKRVQRLNHICPRCLSSEQNIDQYIY